MRVAVIGSESSPTAGGAFTFEESLLSALTGLASSEFEFRFYAVERAFRVAEVPKRGFVALRLLRKLWTGLLRRLGVVTISELRNLAGALAAESLKDTKGWNTDNPLNKAVLADHCELAYFVTPTMVPLEVPFLATHWDLGHRVWPVFPEVSLSGWAWGSREWYFTHWLPRAARIQTGTETGKRELTRAYGIEASHVVVNPFPVPDWLSKTKAEPMDSAVLRRPFLFYPAQFWPHKNHIVLLEMLRILKGEGACPQIVFTGSDKGNLAFLREKVQEYDLVDEVLFFGFVQRSQMLWLYQNTSLMVFPCLIGPDNLPPLEALAAGSPVAVADISGARDYLSAKDVSFFDPTDETALAALVRQVLEKPKPRRTRSPVLPSTSGYAKRTVATLSDIAVYRRCWGLEYQHS